MAFFRLVFTLFCCLPLLAIGVGLGSISIESHLSSPFVAKIPLLIHQGDLASTKVSFAPKASYERMGWQQPAILESLSLEVEPEGNEHFVHIRSKTPIYEASFRLMIRISHKKGSFYKIFNVLLDPPGDVLIENPTPVNASVNRPLEKADAVPGLFKSKTSQQQPKPRPVAVRGKMAPKYLSRLDEDSGGVNHCQRLGWLCPRPTHGKGLPAMQQEGYGFSWFQPIPVVYFSSNMAGSAVSANDVASTHEPHGKPTSPLKQAKPSEKATNRRVALLSPITLEPSQPTTEQQQSTPLSRKKEQIKTLLAKTSQQFQEKALEQQIQQLLLAKAREDKQRQIDRAMKKLPDFSNSLAQYRLTMRDVSAVQVATVKKGDSSDNIKKVDTTTGNASPDNPVSMPGAKNHPKYRPESKTTDKGGQKKVKNAKPAAKKRVSEPNANQQKPMAILDTPPVQKKNLKTDNDAMKASTTPTTVPPTTTEKPHGGVDVVDQKKVVTLSSQPAKAKASLTPSHSTTKKPPALSSPKELTKRNLSVGGKRASKQTSESLPSHPSTTKQVMPVSGNSHGKELTAAAISSKSSAPSGKAKTKKKPKTAVDDTDVFPKPLSALIPNTKRSDYQMEQEEYGIPSSASKVGAQTVAVVHGEDHRKASNTSQLKAKPRYHRLEAVTGEKSLHPKKTTRPKEKHPPSSTNQRKSTKAHAVADKSSTSKQATTAKRQAMKSTTVVHTDGDNKTTGPVWLDLPSTTFTKSPEETKLSLSRLPREEQGTARVTVGTGDDKVISVSTVKMVQDPFAKLADMSFPVQDGDLLQSTLPLALPLTNQSLLKYPVHLLTKQQSFLRATQEPSKKVARVSSLDETMVTGVTAESIKLQTPSSKRSDPLVTVDAIPKEVSVTNQLEKEANQLLARVDKQLSQVRSMRELVGDEDATLKTLHSGRTSQTTAKTDAKRPVEKVQALPVSKAAADRVVASASAATTSAKAKPTSSPSSAPHQKTSDILKAANARLARIKADTTAGMTSNPRLLESSKEVPSSGIKHHAKVQKVIEPVVSSQHKPSAKEVIKPRQLEATTSFKSLYPVSEEKVVSIMARETKDMEGFSLVDGDKYQQFMSRRSIGTGKVVTHEIAPNQTLWRIASLYVKSSDKGIKSLMNAIYLANPKAFIDKDITKLKVGYVLTIPLTAGSQQRVEQRQAPESQSIDFEQGAALGQAFPGDSLSQGHSHSLAEDEKRISSDNRITSQPVQITGEDMASTGATSMALLQQSHQELRSQAENTKKIIQSLQAFNERLQVQNEILRNNQQHAMLSQRGQGNINNSLTQPFSLGMSSPAGIEDHFSSQRSLFIMLLLGLALAAMTFYMTRKIQYRKRSFNQLSGLPYDVGSTIQELLAVGKYHDAMLLLNHEMRDQNLPSKQFVGYLKLFQQYGYLTQLQHYLQSLGLYPEGKIDQPSKEIPRQRTAVTPVVKSKAEVAEKPNHSDALAEITDDDVSIAKLNLATVYINMGDKDRACKLLKEVLSIGDAKLRYEAEKMLQQLELSKQ